MEEGGLAKGTSTVVKVFNWILTLSMAGGLITTYVDPSIIIDMATADVIHHDVEALQDTIKKQLTLEFGKEIEEAKSVHSKLRSRIHFLETQNKTHADLFEGVQKQTDFNTKAISITNEALYEEMDTKIHDCTIKYRETNGGDNWYLVDDWYNSRMLYSVDLRTGCRAYYTPFFREKTKIQ